MTAKSQRACSRSESVKHPRRTRKREIPHNQKSTAGTAYLKRRDPRVALLEEFALLIRKLPLSEHCLCTQGSSLHLYVHTGESPLFYADDPAETVSCRGEWKLLLFSIKSRWLRRGRTKLKCMCKLARLIWRGLACKFHTSIPLAFSEYVSREIPSVGISTQCRKWQTERELNLQC